jgi:hypothetical protein
MLLCRLSISAAILALSSCAALKKKPPVEAAPEVAEKPSAKQIGKVSLIHPDYGFVLIQAGSGVTLTDGTELKCLGPDGKETAKLKATSARQGSYVTADIASGTPRKDDVVFYDPGNSLQQPTAPGYAPEGESKPDPLSLANYPGISANGAPPPTGAAPTISAAPVAGAPGSAVIPDASLPTLPKESLLPQGAPPVDESQLRAVPTVQLGPR